MNSEPTSNAESAAKPRVAVEKSAGTDTNLTLYANRESKKRERAATAFWLFCISLGLFGLLIVNTSSLWNRIIGTSYAPEAIGKIFLQKTDVRYRPSGSIVWMDLTKNSQDVGNGDTVFTAATGSAEIKFNRGNSAQIMPNSLVVIQESDREAASGKGVRGWFDNKLASRAAVNILEGTVKLGFAGDANPIDLKIMGKDYRVSAAGSGSSVNISVDPTNSKKQVSITGDGKIQLEADGKKSLIDPGKIAAVGENKKIEIEEEVFKQSLPRNNARLVIGESTQIGDGRGNLPFEWSRRKTEVGTIEIDGAEHLQVPIQAEDTKTKVPLRSGDYRWRLISRSQKSGSPWFDFSALVVDRPSIRYPAPQTAFRIPHTEDEKEIQLVFSHPNPDFEVETQLYAVGKSGELVLKREDSLQPGARTGQQEVLELELEVGQYQLRARSVYTTKGQNRKVYSPWTQPTTFAIIREPAPTPVPTPRPTPIARKPASEDMNSDSHLKKPAIRPRNGSTIDEPLIIYP